ncbi:MAG: DUF4097 family beta strand repeat-containing protein [Spirochaetia bacterium]
MKVRGLLLLPFLFFAVGGVFGQEIEIIETRDLELATDGIDTLEIHCDSTDVGIAAVEGLGKVSVSAYINIRGRDQARVEEIAAEGILLDLSRRGNRGVLTCRVESTFFLMRLIRGEEKRVQLDIRIPAQMNLDINIEDGKLSVSRLSGNCTVTSGQGDCILEGITGKVGVVDDGGNLRLSNVNGEILIEDGPGDVEIGTSGGSLNLVDTSGDVDIRDFSGPVHIEDSGGSLTVTDLEGDLKIRARGRGDVKLSGVTGTIIQNY